MTPHFTREEFEFSNTAARRGINNRLPDGLLPAAMATLQMMERIRAALSEAAGKPVPIRLSSGYRCQALNQAIGGSRYSDHILAAATDWTAPAFGTPFEVCQFLAPRADALGIGQLIHEFGQWAHTSTRHPSRPVNRIITINNAGTHVGIVRA
jgi:zinc D-Ala-D-Ala carboxypeptidase